MKYLAFLAILITFVISGCETMEGLGRDIQSAGESLEDSADDDDEENKDE